MSYEIKDTGNRRQFYDNNGNEIAVRDTGNNKGDMSLLPWEAIMELSKHCQKGAEKYGKHNIDRGLPVSNLMDSCFRHGAKYLSGWDDEDHLVAAAWNVMWALQMRVTHPELVDVPWYKNTPANKENCPPVEDSHKLKDELENTQKQLHEARKYLVLKLAENADLHAEIEKLKEERRKSDAQE